jgi:hypothetical protein
VCPLGCQELPELALHELRQAHAVAGLRHRIQESLRVERDHLMEHTVLGYGEIGAPLRADRLATRR